MPKKPIHTSSKPQVATVRILHYWGSLLRNEVLTNQKDASKVLSKSVEEFVKGSPTPRDSFVVLQRGYNRALDSYGDWKKVARYNHLGLEIAL